MERKRIYALSFFKFRQIKNGHFSILNLAFDILIEKGLDSSLFHFHVSENVRFLFVSSEVSTKYNFMPLFVPLILYINGFETVNKSTCVAMFKPSMILCRCDFISYGNWLRQKMNTKLLLLLYL